MRVVNEFGKCATVYPRKNFYSPPPSAVQSALPAQHLGVLCTSTAEGARARIRRSEKVGGGRARCCTSPPKRPRFPKLNTTSLKRIKTRWGVVRRCGDERVDCLSEEKILFTSPKRCAARPPRPTLGGPLHKYRGGCARTDPTIRESWRRACTITPHIPWLHPSRSGCWESRRVAVKTYWRGCLGKSDQKVLQQPCCTPSTHAHSGATSRRHGLCSASSSESST